MKTFFYRITKRILLSFLILFLIPEVIIAQVIHPGDPVNEYYQVLEYKNPDIKQRLYVNPAIVYKYQKDSLGWNPWNLSFKSTDDNFFDILPVRVDLSYMSEYPRSINDGAVWKGKGLTTALYAGVSSKRGILEFTLSPVVYYSQNQSSGS